MANLSLHPFSSSATNAGLLVTTAASNPCARPSASGWQVALGCASVSLPAINVCNHRKRACWPQAPCVPWTTIKAARRRIARQAAAALQVVAQWVACSGADDLQGACLLPDWAGLLPQSTHAGHQQIVGFPTFMVARDNHDALQSIQIHCQNCTVIALGA